MQTNMMEMMKVGTSSTVEEYIIATLKLVER